MPFRLLPVLLVLLAAMAMLSGCSSGRTYNTNKGDDEYDLEAMLLRNADAPIGMTEQLAEKYTNEEWAALIVRVRDQGQPNPDDIEKLSSILDAQRRIRNHLAIFGPSEVPLPAKTLLVAAQSTLYTDVEAARRALGDARPSCGMLPPITLLALRALEEPDPSDNAVPQELEEDFDVPQIGDQAIGFTVVHADQGTVVTAVCFRTGRIVHAVAQAGFNGSQDIGLAVRLAQRMLTRVENTLDGRPDPKETPESERPG